ncbi:MAG: trigger factor [Bacteroidota bacterium]|nr:trigger factor [Bacteroidota bacterium]
MASVTKEHLGNLHDKIVVKVSREDYFSSFEKAVKDYSKKANIPGFRKGMVPAGMVKKMYGASIFYDEVIKSVEKELQAYLTEEKPEIFAQPLPMENDLRNLDMNNPGDYDFPFEIGLKPEVTLDALKTAKPVFHKVKATQEMVNEEVEKLITKHGTMNDAETVTAPENVLNVLFEESDAEGNLVAEGISKDNSILIKYFSEEYQQKLQDKKVNDFIVLQLKDAFPEKERDWIISDLNLNKDDISSIEKYFKMTITKIGLVEKKEFNEEFFNQVFPGKEMKTEEEFRKALEEEIQKQWDAASRNQVHDQLYHTLIDTPLQFPDNFLKRWIETGGEKKKSKEEVEAEYPSFATQLKWTLLSDKIIKENQLNVSEEELKSSMKSEIANYFTQMNLGDGNAEWLDSYVDRMMKDEKQVDSTYRKMITQKLFNWLETQVTPIEEETSSEKFLAMQHHHEH